MKSSIACFGLGVVAGVLGALLYTRMQSLKDPEEIDELAERLAENVEELESRLAPILAEVLGE